MANPEHVEVLKAGSYAVNEYREENPGTRFELSGEDLFDVDFEDADLSDANLYRANLNGANLSHAQLSNAMLSGASLARAELFQCDLRGANLSEADLDGAFLARSYLFHADFFQASMREADLSNSYMGWTRFGATNLRGAIGLETVLHQSASTIGIDTIETYGGLLPVAFLRGCGVPEAWIRHIPSLVSPGDYYSSFISYSHADKQFALQLHDRLQEKGIRCWLDEHSMKPGDDMFAEVDKGIRASDKVLLCCSDASLKSWWVGREIDTAIEKEMEFQKAKGEQILKIIPLNMDGALFEWSGSHAAALRKRLAADFTNWKRNTDKFEQQFENVVKALRTDGGQLPPLVPKLGQ